MVLSPRLLLCRLVNLVSDRQGVVELGLKKKKKKINYTSTQELEDQILSLCNYYWLLSAFAFQVAILSANKTA
ncbi:hypothetical protein P3X46_014360 [Hevea brasiliensis]|uniref:Uncharacterized protein n=1 Tax=Hevea brasiliensis TaxID=3981 RepID=A0ABQ9M8V2_HEVBR|nr:hypothetical protein P3X46_014360 [Hevea brasiliensis]